MYEYIHPTPGTPCSTMNVKVTAQLLSTIVSKVLSNC